MKTEILILTLIAGFGLGISTFESKQTKSLKTEIDTSNESFNHSNTDGAESNPDVSSEQYLNMIIILDVLQHYSSDKMESAIEHTYDQNVLDYKDAFIIMNEMSELIKALKNSDSAEVIYEDKEIISLKVYKKKKNYQLDIHFKPYSEKIEKMVFIEMNE